MRRGSASATDRAPGMTPEDWTEAAQIFAEMELREAMARADIADAEHARHRYSDIDHPLHVAGGAL